MNIHINTNTIATKPFKISTIVDLSLSPCNVEAPNTATNKPTIVSKIMLAIANPAKKYPSAVQIKPNEPFQKNNEYL